VLVGIEGCPGEPQVTGAVGRDGQRPVVGGRVIHGLEREVVEAGGAFHGERELVAVDRALERGAHARRLDAELSRDLVSRHAGANLCLLEVRDETRRRAVGVDAAAHAATPAPGATLTFSKHLRSAIDVSTAMRPGDESSMARSISASSSGVLSSSPLRHSSPPPQYTAW